MTSNPHIPSGYTRVQTSIGDYASSSTSNAINSNNVKFNDNNTIPEYTNFQQSLIQKLNSLQYNNHMNPEFQNLSNQGIMDYEEYSLNQSAAEVLTDSGILALHVLSNTRNPTFIRQRMKRYLSKINPD
ncbi:hypothetical protein U3516DRAFT_908965, partial [Neocallimastix sp. 'constans']